jgi:hypothetical protein
MAVEELVHMIRLPGLHSIRGMAGGAALRILHPKDALQILAGNFGLLHRMPELSESKRELSLASCQFCLHKNQGLSSIITLVSCGLQQMKGQDESYTEEDRGGVGE